MTDLATLDPDSIAGLLEEATDDEAALLTEALEAELHRLDPAAWVSDRLGEFLWSKQREIADSVQANRYTAVQACHSAGKSFLAARLAAWWIDTHPAQEAFVVSTAPSGPQIKAILWREINRTHSKGGLPGRLNQSEWWIGSEMVGMGRKPSDYEPTAFQGIHARYVLVIIDEACGIPESLWNAVDSLVTNEDCRVLAIGNPDDQSSHFATVCRPGSGWNVLRVDGLETPNFTDEVVPDSLRPMLLSETWVDERRQRWGESSPLFASKVRGLFPEDSEDSVIPLSWVVAAQNRWREWNDAGRELGPLSAIGIDVARGGSDQTVAAPRHGDIVLELATRTGSQSGDTMATVAWVQTLAGDLAAELIVDSIGVGAGVVDRLREMGYRTVGFVASAGTAMTDATGDLGFINKRAAAWWSLRDMLDPGRDPKLCLPPSDDLAADLSAPKWALRSGRKIQVESKDEIRKRLGRSTDEGDAVIQACWHEPRRGRGRIVVRRAA